MALPAEEPLDSSFAVELPPAPYPGLRPFNKDEWPIFFGREQMTDQVIARVIRQHLVVVHGDSGCGKSSLVRAGVLAQLEQELARSGIRWRTAIALPREAPLRRLAEAIAGLQGAADDLDGLLQIRRILNRGADAPAALAELLRRGDDDHVCILIDQFEELFAFAEQRGREEADLLVEILVGLEKNPPPGLYAILTMRSEFLGHCARYKGLAEAVNRTQYLLPQMERAALIRAICEPALLKEGEVSRALAERVIAEIAGGQDQLPLIQHGLMQLYWDKFGRPTAGSSGLGEETMPYLENRHVLEDAPVSFRHEEGWQEPIAPPADEASDAAQLAFSPGRRRVWRLGLEDYRDRDLAKMLSDHADDIMAKAAPELHGKKIVEHLFRALTDINAEGSAVRRPQTLAELMSVTGSDEETLGSIIDQFREEGVSFLRPYGNAPIAPDSEIDISHEALIRCWQQIADKKDGWLQREFGDGLIWKSLRLQAQRDETLSAAATADRGAWLKALPSRRWCDRYGDGWDEVHELMERSRRARDAELGRRREFEEAKRREAEERARRAEEGHRAAEAARQAAAELAANQKELREAQERIAVEAETRATEAEAGRRRARRLATIAGLLALVAFLAASAAAWFAVDARTSKELAESARVLAESARVKAVEQRDQAAQNESMFRAEEARKELRDDKAVTAMQLALAGLPDNPGTTGARPWVAETAGALVEGMGGQHELKVLQAHQDYVLSVAFAPGGNQVASGSADRTVRVWNLGSEAEPQVLKHNGWVNAVAYSPSGDRIVSASADKTVRLWDPARNKEILILMGHEDDVLSAAFSPDGRRVVSGSKDKTVRVWDAASGRELSVLRGHEGGVTAAGFSPDGGRIVSGSYDNTIRVWDAASGKELSVLRGHQGGVRAASFSRDGARIVSGSDDRTVRVWDPANGKELLVLREHEGPVYAASFSLDGTRIVSGSDDRTVRVWDVASGKELLLLRGHERPVFTAAFSPDGARIVSGAEDKTVRVWKIPSEAVVARGHEKKVRAAGFSPDGARILSGSWDKTVRVWDAASGKQFRALLGHDKEVLASAFSPDGAHIVSGSEDETVREWDAASGKELLVLRDAGWINAVGYSPTGDRIMSASAKGTVRVWGAASGKELLVLKGHEGDVLAAAFSPDGTQLASASADKTVRVWNTVSGQCLRILRGHEGPVNAVAFSPDGRRIASGSADDTVWIWDAASGTEFRRLKGHDADVSSVAFSPQGDRIVSGGDDGTVRLWDVASGSEVLVLRSHGGPVRAVAFSPDGVHIVSGSDDQTVTVTWVPHSKQELIETAYKWLPRKLTEAERRYFHVTTE
jgi:WD40 repeat protein/ABC-type dipeptide/oligopeptide/nickel transport system ATPase subunit